MTSASGSQTSRQHAAPSPQFWNPIAAQLKLRKHAPLAVSTSNSGLLHGRHSPPAARHDAAASDPSLPASGAPSSPASEASGPPEGVIPASRGGPGLLGGQPHQMGGKAAVQRAADLQSLPVAIEAGAHARTPLGDTPAGASLTGQRASGASVALARLGRICAGLTGGHGLTAEIG